MSKMKRTLLLGIAVLIAFSLLGSSACSGRKPSPSPTPTPTPTPTPITTLVPEWKVKLPEPEQPPKSLKIYPIDDSYVIENYDEKSFGAEQSLLAGRTFSGDKNIAFLKFDLTEILSQIPKEAEIIGADLAIFVPGIAWPWDAAVRVAFAEGSWQEDNLIWSNAPKEGYLIWSGQLMNFQPLLIIDITSRIQKDLKNNVRTLDIGIWPEGDQSFMASISSKESQNFPKATFLKILYRLPAKPLGPNEILVRQPGFSLTDEGLIAIDLQKIQGATVLERAQSLTKELNEKGFLLFSINDVKYNEDAGFIKFTVDIFSAIYFDSASGFWSYQSDPNSS